MEQRSRAGTGNVAAAILPAVEPGRPARRIKRNKHTSCVENPGPLKPSTVLSGRPVLRSRATAEGGRDASPLRQTRRLPLHRLGYAPINTAAGIWPSIRARVRALCGPPRHF